MQGPAAGQINLDHVAHFVPHLESASAELEKLGFTLTPFSSQSHRFEPGGPLVPAGTGNRCAMFQSGYLEFLTPTGNTPVADQLRSAIKRYVGVHLVALGTAMPDLDHARISKAGFEPLAPVALQRQVATAEGEDTARFTVVRVSPGMMAEGRIQFVRHHTPHLLWQQRWLQHENHAIALAGVVLCVADPQEAAQRYSRFTGLPSQPSDGLWRIDTARGCLLFVEPETLQRAFALEPRALPWIAGYLLTTDNPAATRSCLTTAGAVLRELDADRFLVSLPPEIGGTIIFEAPQSTRFSIK
jgi:hypothetical protein